MNDNLDKSPLGKKNTYKSTYDKSLLFPISRDEKRKEIGIDKNHLPFYGYDLFNAYEVSWLNQNGKPLVKIAQIYYNASSDYLIESKSLKLYLNSFNNNNFSNENEVIRTIQKDLKEFLKTDVHVSFKDLSTKDQIFSPSAICIDEIDVIAPKYNKVDSNIIELEKTKTQVSESLYSNLLKSNCLITGQPDWGTIEINYTGQGINHESLLKYIISYRNHNEFHEQCIERIFMDIKNICNTKSLSVLGRYTRRGGIDINPFRSTNEHFKISNQRLIRQ
ncbi:MAG: 7-cyano-7-deazaguanine reductase [Candidatus Midichloriaceae bacterium]|jgi:7-cyano-7-deazaguanine reductase